MDLLYRKANRDDIATLITIGRSALGIKTYSPIIDESEWEQELNNILVYIIEVDGQVAGLISYEMKSSNHAYISDLVILPTYRGKGIARESMNHVLNEIGKTEKIKLVVHPENISAIHLYQSFGFTLESSKENYFGDGEPRITMVLKP